MSEEREGRRTSRGRRVLARVAYALDVLPDGLATGLGLGLGLATAVAAFRGEWLWLGVVAAGLAFLLGRDVGARPRREGLVLPVVSAVALAGLVVVLVGVTWPRGEGGDREWVIADREDFLRVDLGDGGTEAGTSAGESSGEVSSDSGGTTGIAESTSGTDSTSTTSGDEAAPERSPPPRPSKPLSSDEGSMEDSATTTGGLEFTSDGGEEADGGERTLPFCRNGSFIEGGSFADHVVKDLCMDETEVTVSQYNRCVEKGICAEAYTGKYCNAGKQGRGRHPINCVDWDQADTYCRKFAGKRLPTQWEWEWAARGRDRGWAYPWGDSPEPSCERVVMTGEGVDGCGRDSTWAVGSKSKGDSRDGLKDMAGNVWEWTASVEGERRVVRGGSWVYGSSHIFRVSDSLSIRPAVRGYGVGFRCARTSGGSL